MLHVHGLTFDARLRQTKTTDCPLVLPRPPRFETSFSLTSANINEKRLDQVRDGREIDSRRKCYIASPVPREEGECNVQTWITVEMEDDARCIIAPELYSVEKE